MILEKINLLGYELNLYQRTVNDYYKFIEFINKEKKTGFDSLYADAFFVEQSLKRNLEKELVTFFIFGKEVKIPKNPFRHYQLKNKLKARYLMANLSRQEIKDFIKKIYFLETGEVLKDEKEEAEEIKQRPSRERLVWLIHHFGNFSMEEISKMNISDFFEAVDNALAIAGLYAGNGYELITAKDKQLHLKEELELFIKQGRLKRKSQWQTN